MGGGDEGESAIVILAGAITLAVATCLWLVVTLRTYRGERPMPKTPVAGHAQVKACDLIRLAILAFRSESGSLIEALQTIEGDPTMTDQEKLDALAAVLDTTATNLRGDVDVLKAAAAANKPLDFTKIDATVAALQALDLENPPPITTAG